MVLGKRWLFSIKNGAEIGLLKKGRKSPGSRLTVFNLFIIETPFDTSARRADPDQAALEGAAWSGSTLFANGNVIYLILHKWT